MTTTTTTLSADRVAVAFGAAVHCDAEFCGRGQIDVFQTRPAPCNPLKVGEGMQHFCIEADSASQDQPMHRTEVAGNEGFARDTCAVMTHHACLVEGLPQGLVHHIQKPNVL